MQGGLDALSAYLVSWASGQPGDGIIPLSLQLYELATATVDEAVHKLHAKFGANH